MFDLITTAQASVKRYEALEPLGPAYFGERWRIGLASGEGWDELKTLADWLAGTYDQIHSGELPEYTIPFLNQRAQLVPLRERITELQSVIKNQEETRKRIRQLLEFDDKLRFGNGDLGKLALSEQGDLFGDWRQSLGALPEIIALNHTLGELSAPELAPLIELALSWREAGKKLSATLKNAWFELLAETALKANSNLSQFNGENHDATIKAFRDLDLMALDYNRKRLAVQHYRGLPTTSDHGQMWVLSREFQKKSRHLPIRQLMLRAGNAIQSIKPVFMMSPLSIAQFVPPQSLGFDLVVFDEASQVRPAEALGAIVRGDQTIVVGDSRQLPPTSFFSVFTQSEEDEETATSDIESVLGLFAAQGAPERMLRWHYRSRHESLIAVSNKEFYENRLLIFPSPDMGREDTGLVFHHLPHTVYDRGGSSTNIAEARAVAKAVMEHAKARPELTLGVAAFSSKQMMTIEDMVEEQRREDPSCEGFFAAHPHEPFFVKNLETVQGDERDVILISLGYGRDASGKVSMNFGPLNRDGGQRRLNVLITRARRRCEVFSNITADDIDTRQTAAWGVRSLKTFLHYAQHGKLNVAEETGRDFDSPFEEAVFRALTNTGYQLHKQVGSAGYFIDLAVVDPAKPGRYLLAIECDGALYHSSQSARDRDRLRQQVLEGLGWKIHRIWSTDWFRNPGRELGRAVEAIERAKLTVSIPTVIEPKRVKPPAEIERNEAKRQSERSRAIFYEAAEVTMGAEVGPDLHMVPTQRLADWMVTVVEVESPVHIDEVARRICDAAGIKRRGTRITAAMASASRFAARQGRIAIDGSFLWLPNQDKCVARDRSRLAAASRKIELVAPKELEAAILEAIKTSMGLPKDEIPSVAARYLGFNRTSGAIDEAFQQSIDQMIQDDRLARHGEDLIAA
jgi:very-short-patch-repair endonuclease